MPRRARLAVAGIPWHIVQRGNNREACFFCDEDYRYYLDTLAQQARKHGCTVHAYVLMTNHVHLLVTPREKDGVSRLMKHLGQRYVQYVDRTYRRSGTLWEGRFHSCLTREDRYVLACYRYIEMNPVRANMVDDPAVYPWSSYRANALGCGSDLITGHDEYLTPTPRKGGRRTGRCLKPTRSDSWLIVLERRLTGTMRLAAKDSGSRSSRRSRGGLHQADRGDRNGQVTVNRGLSPFIRLTTTATITSTFSGNQQTFDITLSADEPATTQFRITGTFTITAGGADTSDWQAYTGSIQGEKLKKDKATLEYYSTDTVGNQEATKAEELK